MKKNSDRPTRDEPAISDRKRRPCGVSTRDLERLAAAYDTTPAVILLAPPDSPNFENTLRFDRWGDWGLSQGLRMKDAGQDLLHVLIVPRGHFPPSLQAGF